MCRQLLLPGGLPAAKAPETSNQTTTRWPHSRRALLY